MDPVNEISLDDSGRIVIRGGLRNRLGLSPGMTLIVEAGDKADLRLRVQSESPKLREKEGVLVVTGEPVDDLADIIRRERDRRVFELSQRTGR